MDSHLIVQIVFWSFASVALLAAFGVVATKKPVNGVLWLIVTFICMASLWILMSAEFLGLALLFVYVGAVMALFLFVVMMLNSQYILQKHHGWRLGGFLISLGLAVFSVVYLLKSQLVKLNAQTYLNIDAEGVHQGAKALGHAIYGYDGLLPLALIGCVLLAAMISAIALVYQGKRSDSKTQKIDQQVSVSKAQRLKIISSQEAKHVE
ncbi:NADH-quinone oxidoreductase subunit J [Gammaproteobacteria bacterium]|nr:NADH-quinone oxidoreductase subunit J [Gammaproteobacteria bacterium]